MPGDSETAEAARAEPFDVGIGTVGRDDSQRGGACRWVGWCVEVARLRSTMPSVQVVQSQ